MDPTLGVEQIRLFSQRLLAGDEETLLFLFLEILRRVNSATPSPSTPSGMIPPHLKATTQICRKRQKKMFGDPKHHPGTRLPDRAGLTTRKNNSWYGIPTAAVQICKIMYGNRSDQGALTQGVLMSIFRTLKRRGYNPIATLVAALREYVRTGHLPPFLPLISEG